MLDPLIFIKRYFSNFDEIHEEYGEIYMNIMYKPRNVPMVNLANDPIMMEQFA